MFNKVLMPLLALCISTSLWAQGGGGGDKVGNGNVDYHTITAIKISTQEDINRCEFATRLGDICDYISKRLILGEKEKVIWRGCCEQY